MSDTDTNREQFNTPAEAHHGVAEFLSLLNSVDGVYLQNSDLSVDTTEMEHLWIETEVTVKLTRGILEATDE